MRPTTAPVSAEPGAETTAVDLEVELGPMVAGGVCLARVADGPRAGTVVLVRHGLPGERVGVRLTGAAKGGRLLRGDAVKVLRPGVDRVDPPCPVAVPGGCGGCDLQHASLPAQRRLKAGIVADALHRIGGSAPAEAGFDGQVRAVPVPGAARDDGLRWRTRSRFWAYFGGLAMRRHRGHDLVAIADCPIAMEQVVATAAAAAGSTPDGAPVIVPHPQVVHRAAGRAWTVSGDGFWQVHAGAADALVDVVLKLAGARAGEHVWDLYSGVGLFGGAVAAGTAVSVTAVEGSRRAVADARRNTADLPGVRTVRGDVAAWLGAAARGTRDRAPGRRRAPAAHAPRPDVVILDPPRSGAGPAVMAALAGSGARAIVYVACDPAALARDLRAAADAGWVCRRIEALDLFPMTHHVECVALLQPAG